MALMYYRDLVSGQWVPMALPGYEGPTGPTGPSGIGVWVGPNTPPEGYKEWIDTDEDPAGIAGNDPVWLIVPTYANLPASGAYVGQQCLVDDSDLLFAWTGTAWVEDFTPGLLWVKGSLPIRSQWANKQLLPGPDGTALTADSTVEDGLRWEGYIKKSGDTMTGSLTVPDIGANTVSIYVAPTLANHAATKGYVDTAAAAPDLAARLKEFSYFTDYVLPPGTTAVANEIYITSNGTGAATSSTASETGRMGLVRSTTGTTAAGRTAVASPVSVVVFETTPWIFETELRITALSTATERFQLLVGFIDTLTAANQVDGAYFLYDEGGVSTGSAASANWQTCVVANSARSFADTGIPVDLNWVRLRVEATATEVRFYLNGTLVRTVSSGIPSGTTRAMGFGVLMNKSVGTTARTVDYDWLYTEHETGR